MKLLKSNGFGLLEVMIAAGLLGGLALAGMTLFKNQTTAQKTIEKNYEVTVTNQQIRTVLSTPANCTQSLIGQSSNGGTVSVLKKKMIDGTFEDVFKTNVTFSGGIKIKEYKILKGYPDLASNEVMLNITYARGKGTLTDEVSKNIKLIITEAAGNILTCYAHSSGTEIWSYGLDGTSIFYNGGDVAVGKADPDATLDVAGEVKLASTGIACTAANEGSIRYNPDPLVKNIEVCDGTMWKGNSGSGSLTPNGWWTFGGGIMIQWGHDTISGDNTDHTFAKPFPNACLMTLVTSWNRSSKGINGHNHVGFCNQTKFRATIEGGVSVGAGWIAIGF
jgi:type II secretory pathway pseudopilin PulG